jgi:hypothetical protein
MNIVYEIFIFKKNYKVCPMKWICIFLLFLTSYAGGKEKEYIVLHCRDNAGMFSILFDVLSLTKQYEKGHYNGIEVDFMTEGLYYSSEKGPNWFTYYCEPIQIGEKKNVRHIYGDAPFADAYDIEFHTTRHEANHLINNHIHVKQEILDEISEFFEKHFLGNFVISVHYRGTDKITEAPPVSFSEIKDKIIQLIISMGYTNYKIFVATDEQVFIDYMENSFGDKVCYNEKAIRSINSKPLHFSNNDRYKIGRDAMIDSILLSKGDYMLRMSSNLSLWSTFLNSEMPVCELNQRY